MYNILIDQFGIKWNCCRSVEQAPATITLTDLVILFSISHSLLSTVLQIPYSNEINNTVVIFVWYQNWKREKQPQQPAKKNKTKTWNGHEIHMGEQTREPMHARKLNIQTA